MAKTSVVITYLEGMCNALERHIGELKSKERSTGKNLVKPFNDISNKVNIAIPISHCVQERLQYFETNTPATPKDIWAQVSKTVYRDFLFVATMSTIEYYFIKILLQYPNFKTARKIQKKGPRKVKISELTRWAYEEKILDDYDLWDFVISARNDIVHYNAIVRSTKACPITDFPIDMVQGQELSGKLRSLLSLTKHVEESFFNVVFRLHD